MGDRFKKQVEHAFDHVDVTDNDVLTSPGYNTYDTPICGLLIGIERTGAPTNIRVEVQFSPDQGNTWFTLEDAVPNPPVVFPSNIAIGNIHCVGAYARILVQGQGCNLANYYTVSVYFVHYRA